MNDHDERGLEELDWQPKRMLEKFRATVTALSAWEAPLLVQREISQAGICWSALTESELKRFTCDVAFICSAPPAQELVQSAIQQASLPARPAIANVYEQLRESYRSGASPRSWQVGTMVNRTVGGKFN